ncbi:MAG: indole-3-glycerol phosphate synthase TrpC, partial [Dolichospermum sp.]
MQIRRRSPNPSINISIIEYKSAIEGAAPNNILEEIVWHKETEVEKMRERLPLRELQTQVLTVPPTRDFIAALRYSKTNPALIAELKKASPSKGILKTDFDPVAIARSYQAGGASCLSVLTDVKFFQGSFQNLSLVRSTVDLPLLCKDFIIYPYQMYWARINGADAVLLIAAILNDQDLQYFIKIAHNLKMAALIEVHNLEELDRVLALDGVSLIGINNRNLEDFTVDLQTTSALMTARSEQLQAKNILVVSESGLHHPEDLKVVKTAGVSAVLIGESLVKQPDPQIAIT